MWYKGKSLVSADASLAEVSIMKCVRLLAVVVLACSGCVENNELKLAQPYYYDGSTSADHLVTGGTPASPPAAMGGAPATGTADPLKCEPPSGQSGAALHAAAQEVMGTMGRSPNGVIGACAGLSCHVPPKGQGDLVLNMVADLHTLVGKQSCEAASLKLVSGTMGDQGLQESWLWQKMVAPANPSTGALIPNAAWGPGNAPCGGITPDAPFGVRMPKAGDTTMYLNEARLGPIRRWICAGAPGPQ